MIEKGSLVKLVGMKRQFQGRRINNKGWLDGAVGTVIKYDRVSNVNTGKVSEICIIQLLVPYLNSAGKPIDWVSGINVINIEEIIRKPIITKEK